MYVGGGGGKTRSHGKSRRDMEHQPCGASLAGGDQAAGEPRLPPLPAVAHSSLHCMEGRC